MRRREKSLRVWQRSHRDLERVKLMFAAAENVLWGYIC